MGQIIVAQRVPHLPPIGSPLVEFCKRGNEGSRLRLSVAAIYILRRRVSLGRSPYLCR